VQEFVQSFDEAVLTRRRSHHVFDVFHLNLGAGRSGDANCFFKVRGREPDVILPRTATLKAADHKIESVIFECFELLLRAAPMPLGTCS
jgi:hypothetical protein